MARGFARRCALAYVSIAAASRKLHVRTLDNGQDSTVLTDARVERPTWSPAGDRLAWTATGARGAVYVSPLDGRYVNLVSARHAESAWSPDGKTITLADLPPTEPIAPVGYNGDPDRTGDREANLLVVVGGRMWTIDAPSRPTRSSPSSKDRPRSIARRATPTRSTSSGIARPRCTTRRRTRRRGARSGKRSRRSTVRAPSPRRPTTSSRRCCTTCCASIRRTSSRRPAAPRCRARIPSRRPPDSRCWRRAATSSTRPSPCRSRSASSSPTRAVRAATARCSSTRKGMDRPQLIEFMSRVPGRRRARRTRRCSRTGACPTAGPRAGERARHRRRDVPRVAEVRQQEASVGRSAAAGDPRRARRLRRERRARDDARHRARAVSQVRREPRAVLPRRPAAARRRHAQESRSRVDARADRAAAAPTRSTRARSRRRWSPICTRRATR